MRLLSTLLVAALGGVVGAAPAAPVALPEAPKREKPEKDTKQPEQESVGRVVLRADNQRGNDTTVTGGEAQVTVDAAPALRVRRLPPPPLYTPPVLDQRADVRAGLFDTPPPQA